MKPITYRAAARKTLRRMPQKSADLIMDKIEQYAEDPASLANNVTALTGRESIRLRVGGWRVITHDGEVLDVVKIGPRAASTTEGATMGDTITISREEYDRLRAAAEDLSDIEAYDRAMREGGEGLPHAYMRRIVAGETPLRVFREWRGMTGADLGRAAGMHRVVVHEIETGKKRGSIDTIRRLAEALRVTVDDLI